MGILHQFDKQKRIAFVVWDGRVQWEDWRKHVQLLLSDPDWFQVQRFMVDLQTVTDTSGIGDEEIEEIRKIFSSDPLILAGKRTAIIASEEFRKASRFSSFVERFGTASVVFNSLDTACLFLGIDQTYARQAIQGLRAQLRYEEDRP